jgi:hypothetical protein
MLRPTRYAAMLAATILSSAGLMFGGATAQADQDAPVADAAAKHASQTGLVKHAKPEAGGRVIKSARAAGPAWPGSSEPAKPEAGGRVITSSHAAAGPAWPGSTAQAKPEAGGRVITPSKLVADDGSAPQRTSAVACTAEATAADRC